jgi:hypothetical protein
MSLSYDATPSRMELSERIGRPQPLPIHLTLQDYGFSLFATRPPR